MNPVGALLFARALPEEPVLFVHNANRYLDDAALVQGVWNLPDQFKQDRRMLILLGHNLKLPAESCQVTWLSRGARG